MTNMLHQDCGIAVYVLQIQRLPTMLDPAFVWSIRTHQRHDEQLASAQRPQELQLVEEDAGAIVKTIRTKRWA